LLVCRLQKKFVCRHDIGPRYFDKLNPEPGPDPKSPTRLTTLPQSTKNFPEQKNLSRTEQRYVGRTAVKVYMTDTRLDLLIAN